MATPKQIKLIHVVKGALLLDDATYRAMLAGYGVESSKDLRDSQAELLLHDLQLKAEAAGVWKRRGIPRPAGKRPHNLNAGRYDRAAQLQKIEALLTVGKKPWGYADALAKRICKEEVRPGVFAETGPELIAWAPTHLLYKVITALRKQAQREGWDLSGEAR